MQIILEKYKCYIRQENIETDVGGNIEEIAGPSHYIIEGKVGVLGCDQHDVSVKALIDTGTDITIVNPEIVRMLEQKMGKHLPLKRSYCFNESVAPAYALAFKLGDQLCFNSEMGFIAPQSYIFDIADIYIGQDIFGQYIITLDGIDGTITIAKP